MIPRLAFLATFLTLCTAAIPSSSPPKSPAHCECRCCTRTHFHTTCSEPPQVVPLTQGHGCDTHLPILHNPSVCGPALCKAHFADLCPPPAFMEHACISDRGLFRDWAPLAFVSLALLLSVYVASMFAARIPPHRMKTGYKRPDAFQPSTDVSQPLVSASSFATSYGVEVLDLSPRRTVTLPISPPVRSLSEPRRSDTSPLYVSQQNTSPLQNVIITPQHTAPIHPTLQPTQQFKQAVQAPDSEGDDQT